MKRGFAISLIFMSFLAVRVWGQTDGQEAGHAVTQTTTEAMNRGAGQVGAKVLPRVAGLENNNVYMSLLREELRLRSREDSLAKVVAALRTQLRDDVENRAQHSSNILRLEGLIFDIRNNIGRIASQTGAIEQEFIINNLIGESTSAPSGTTLEPKAEDISAFLSLNPYFREKLPAADYQALREADEKEAQILNRIREFSAHYDTLDIIAQEYMQTDSALVADSLWSCYLDQKQILENISADVHQLDAFILDNKTYSYLYLLDVMNESVQIGRFNERSLRASDEKSQLAGKTQSDDVSAYPIHKRLTLYYEQTLARMLGLGKALDSLKRAESDITSISFDFPPINLEERLFLDYDSITIHSPSLYTASNPIPGLKVYEKGAIYRIMLGSFTRAQPVSIFRGAYPIGVLRDEEGKYNYYAGGFATQTQAEAALEQMKKVGFRVPKIALWDYGNYSLPDQQQLSANRPASAASLFRIDITGTKGDLPEAVKTAIRESAPGKDIARIENKFTVGPFNTDGEAEKLAHIIRMAEGSLEITVVDISQENQ